MGCYESRYVKDDAQALTDTAMYMLVTEFFVLILSLKSKDLILML
jgi:hypothetical protein